MTHEEQSIDEGLVPSVVLTRYRDEVLELARRHRASRVRVFGSVARGEDKFGSDVDLLVRFDEGASLYDLVELQEDLTALLGIRVDVVSEAGLRRRGLAMLSEARTL